jgi:hypothetical protein
VVGLVDHTRSAQPSPHTGAQRTPLAVYWHHRRRALRSLGGLGDGGWSESSARVPPRGRNADNAHGGQQTIFLRAIEHGNLTVAEATVREMGVVSLEEALELTALAAFKGPPRRSAYALRWLRRLLEEDANLTIDQAALAASALASLGGSERSAAIVVARGARLTSRAAGSVSVLTAHRSTPHAAARRSHGSRARCR